MIDWYKFAEMTLLGSIGAFALEILKVSELKGKLHHKKYVAILRSPLFWIVGFLSILVSGFIAYAFNAENPAPSTWQVVISGMGASAITKKFSETLASNTRINAGDNDEVDFRDLFR